MPTPTSPASPFGALALLATARAALVATQRVAERRAGRDASAQEPEAVTRPDLAVLADRLAAHAVRLRLRAATRRTEDTETAALALAFEDHVLLSDLAATAAVTHQKLLSLFPAVEPALAEAARRLARDAEALAGSDAADLSPGPLAEATAGLVDALRLALA